MSIGQPMNDRLLGSEVKSYGIDGPFKASTNDLREFSCPSFHPASTSCPAKCGLTLPRLQNVVLKKKRGPLAQPFFYSSSSSG